MKLNREQQHRQCMREIRWTLGVAAVCCLWHVLTAFLLNGSGRYFLGMPAWFSVSTFGTVLLAAAGVVFLLKRIFVDFDYDAEKEESDHV